MKCLLTLNTYRNPLHRPVGAILQVCAGFLVAPVALEVVMPGTFGFGSLVLPGLIVGAAAAAAAGELLAADPRNVKVDMTHTARTVHPTDLESAWAGAWTTCSQLTPGPAADALHALLASTLATLHDAAAENIECNNIRATATGNAGTGKVYLPAGLIEREAALCDTYQHVLDTPLDCARSAHRLHADSAAAAAALPVSSAQAELVRNIAAELALTASAYAEAVTESDEADHPETLRNGAPLPLTASS